MGLLDPEEAAAVKRAQELLESPTLQADLTFVRTQVAFLPSAITQLEKKGISLVDSIKIFEDAREKIEGIPGPKGIDLKEKMMKIVERNKEYS